MEFRFEAALGVFPAPASAVRDTWFALVSAVSAFDTDISPGFDVR
jgi:hypothetical protein